MARKRKFNRHLPQGMQIKHGAYYLLTYVEGKRKWILLSREFQGALQKYSELVGKKHREDPTVAGAMARHLILFSDKLKVDTMAGYRQSARRLAPVFGHMMLPDLKRSHVYRYLTERGNVAANRDRAFLSAVYTNLINAGEFDGPNPCQGLRFRNPERPRQRYLTDDEFEKLVAALPPKLSLMARWAYLTGMRQSRMLAMKLSDATPVGVQFDPGKRRKGNPVTLILIEWTDELRQVWKEAAGTRIGAMPLFPTANGTHYSRDSFQSIWQRWRKKIPIADLRWHDIRRKTGSDSATDAEASERLTHADEAVTKAHYRAKPKRVKPLR
jgi:integrase